MMCLCQPLLLKTAIHWYLPENTADLDFFDREPQSPLTVNRLGSSDHHP